MSSAKKRREFLRQQIVDEQIRIAGGMVAVCAEHAGVSMHDIAAEIESDNARYLSDDELRELQE